MCVLEWVTPDYWQKIGHPEAWASIVGGGLTALVTLLSVLIASILTYRFTLRHSRVVHGTAVRADRLRREIDALEQIWSLLAYMSMQESEKTIVRWREDRQKNRTYFVHFGNLKHFLLHEMSRAFYHEHAGLFMPKEIRDRIFDYGGSLMGLYLRYEDDGEVTGESLIELENRRLIEKLENAYGELNRDLKKELEERYGCLLKTE